MKHFTLMAGALAGLLLAGTANADGKGHGNDHGKSGHSQGDNCGSGKKGHGCNSHGQDNHGKDNRGQSKHGKDDHDNDGHASNRYASPIDAFRNQTYKEDDIRNYAEGDTRRPHHKPGWTYVYDPNHWSRHDDDDIYYQPYRVGHTLPEGYVVMFDPTRYPSWPNSNLVRYGSFLYLIDLLTGNVTQNVGPVDDWNWGWHDTTYANCPPGLAKKNPPCIPPGQVRNGVPYDPYQIGQRLPSGYDVILRPPVQGVPDNSIYARSGDMLYRVAPDTGIVEQQYGEVGRLIQ